MKPKTEAEIQSMREAGKIVADVLQTMVRMARPGVTLSSLDKIAQHKIQKAGGVPACLGYRGFPAAVCMSVNDVAVHGIPTDYALKEGDVVGFDTVVSFNGMHADSAITIPIGTSIAPEAHNLLVGTKTALDMALSLCKPGNHILTISMMIQSMALQFKLMPAKNLSGHGIGREMHEPPCVPNTYDNAPMVKLVPGMTLAIEPILCQGVGDVSLDPDGWSIRTADGKLAAQFEHTVLITETGCEILTAWSEESKLCLPAYLR